MSIVFLVIRDVQGGRGDVEGIYASLEAVLNAFPDDRWTGGRPNTGDPYYYSGRRFVDPYVVKP